MFANTNSAQHEQEIFRSVYVRADRLFAIVMGVQAVGLLVLCRLLFGGLRGHGWHGRAGMLERWEQMTPEERERLRTGLRGRCGPWGRRS